MPAATTTIAPAWAEVSARSAWPSLVESILAIAAILALLPLFERFGIDTAGRDRRFADEPLAVHSLPSPVLPAVCATQARLADPQVRDRLCTQAGSASEDQASLPRVLVEAWRQTGSAFEQPALDARARLAELRHQQSADAADAGALLAAESLANGIRSYSQRYALEGDSGPRPLACAFHTVANAERASASGNARRARELANGALLLAAAIDGHAATGALARSASLDGMRSTRAAQCATSTLDDAFARGAALMADARGASSAREKNEASRALLANGGWQWAAWMLAGLVFVKLARTRMPASGGIALALAFWSVAAWAGRVPWPLAADRAFAPARVHTRWDAMPADFVLVFLAFAAVLAACSPWLRKRFQPVPQTLASRIGFPGFVVATGIGWLLLLDLSANGPPGNRYLALYHHGHLWFAMVAFSVLAFARPVLGRALAWSLAVADELGGRIGRLLGPLLAPAALVALVVAIVGVTGALLSGVRQFTSELGRVWLIVGVAWFFFLRGAPAADRLATSGRPITSLVRYAWPLAFVGAVLVGAMLVTRDMGPLLIASYGAGAFLAASIAMWWHIRSGAIRAPAVLAIVMFAAWIVGITQLVFEFGAIDEVTAGRLENLAAPLASANDQLALVAWFRQAAPPTGFGLGSVPWCGFASAGSCAGVPAQIQSDYTFTALVGAFGWSAAWGLTLGCAVWLHRLIRHHGRVTRGEPRFVRQGDRVVADHQALLSWIAVCWVVLTLCQLAVTVAGNLAVVPLTGVTFPFVSFGMTSLVVNASLLALCVNVDLPVARDA